MTHFLLALSGALLAATSTGRVPAIVGLLAVLWAVVGVLGEERKP